MSLKGSNYPTVRPSLDLQFAQTKRLDPRISYSRSGVATYYDETGILRTAQANQARFDHDPTTGESLGLLVEEARTNSILYSDALDGGKWLSPFGFSRIVNTPYRAQDPAGTFRAKEVRSTSSSGSAYHSYYSNTGVGTGNWNFSIYVKPVNVTTLSIRVDGAYGVGSTFFDLNGAGSVVSGPGSFTKLSNGWWRLSTYGDITTHQRADCSINYTSVGDDSIAFYLWGAQLEAGSFPTSYIPTPATFTSRSTTATYYDSSGVIQTAGVDVARDSAYLPDENGVMRPAGLLLEAEGTNTLPNSSDIGATLNDATNASITSDTITAPDGTSSADTITFTSSGSVQTSGGNIAINGSIWTYSIFLKAGTISAGVINYMGRASCSFDLIAGTVSFTFGSAGNAGGGIEKLSNGWYRVYTVYDATSDINRGLRITSTVAGTLHAWGIQNEQGSRPTSYIPTDGTPGGITRAADVSTSPAGGVTRSADVAQITGTNFSSWYNQSEGTVYCNILAPTRGTGASTYQVVSINDGTVNEHIGLSRSFDPVQIDANVVTGYSTQALFSIYPIPVANQKIALTYKSNYSNLAASRILSSADTNLIVPNPTQLNIGQDSAYTTYGLNSTISRLTYYPVRLPDATLQKITQ